MNTYTNHKYEMPLNEHVPPYIQTILNRVSVPLFLRWIFETPVDLEDEVYLNWRKWLNERDDASEVLTELRRVFKTPQQVVLYLLENDYVIFLQSKFLTQHYMNQPLFKESNRIEYLARWLLLHQNQSNELRRRQYRIPQIWDLTHYNRTTFACLHIEHGYVKVYYEAMVKWLKNMLKEKGA